MDKIARQRRQGFTLIELLVVMAIMLIMMSLAVVGFLDFGRGTGMRTAVLNFKTTFSHARQHAITHRVRTQFHYGNLPRPGPPPTPGTPPWRGYYYVSTTDGSVIGVTNVLPEGVTVSNGPPVTAGDYDDVFVEFKLDGSCSSDANGDGSSADEWFIGNDRTLFLVEGGRSKATTNYIKSELKIYRAQGSMQQRNEE